GELGLGTGGSSILHGLVEHNEVEHKWNTSQVPLGGCSDDSRIKSALIL
ncbi:unnamed protein product, partial [Ascophyllum nodosum]